ncbi:MAG: hypothetical protein HYU64_21750, partial [Armatimonadetes bacterium]|nr:hypothetical protein [Armatimonadota bacterium]
MAEVSANMNITQAAVPFAGQSSVLEAKKLEAPAQVMVSGKDSVQPASVEELKAQVSELKALIEKTARTPAGKSRGFLADLRDFAANHPAVAGVVSGLTGGLAGVAIGEIRNNRELRKQLKEMETHLEEAGISKKTALSPQPESPAVPPSKGKTLLEKEDAMNLLLDAEEGDAQGAGADFSLVAKSVGHGGETMREAAEQFVRLLELEGSSQTTKAQEDYAIIDGTLKPGQKRTEAVTQFLRLADAENDTFQARGDFALLQRNLPSG